VVSLALLRTGVRVVLRELLLDFLDCLIDNLDVLQGLLVGLLLLAVRAGERDLFDAVLIKLDRLS